MNVKKFKNVKKNMNVLAKTTPVFSKSTQNVTFLCRGHLYYYFTILGLKINGILHYSNHFLSRSLRQPFSLSEEMDLSINHLSLLHISTWATNNCLFKSIRQIDVDIVRPLTQACDVIITMYVNIRFKQ